MDPNGNSSVRLGTAPWSWGTVPRLGPRLTALGSCGNPGHIHPPRPGREERQQPGLLRRGGGGQVQSLLCSKQQGRAFWCFY